MVLRVSCLASYQPTYCKLGGCHAASSTQRASAPALSAVVPARAARERGARNPTAHAAADAGRAGAEPRRPGRGVLHGRVAAAARRRAPAIVPGAGGGRARAYGRRAGARRANAHTSHRGPCAAGRARARRRLGERLLGAWNGGSHFVGSQHASSVLCRRDSA